MSECKAYIAVPGKDQYEHQFGGDEWDMDACNICKGDIHQIITLDLEDPRLEDFRNPTAGRIPMVSCLNCSASWWRQGYVISNNRIEWDYQDVEEADVMTEEDRIPTPLPVIPVQLAEYNDSNTEQFWKDFGTKFLCKVGGNPIWAQEEVELKCPECGKPMKFVAMICGEKEEGTAHLMGEVPFGLGTCVYYYAVCTECGEITVDCQEKK